VFGPVVAVGDGGKYVEIFRDTTAAAAAVLQGGPPGRRWEDCGSRRYLTACRGEPPMDVDALSQYRRENSVELMLDPMD